MSNGYEYSHEIRETRYICLKLNFIKVNFLCVEKRTKKNIEKRQKMCFSRMSHHTTWQVEVSST